MKRAKVKCVSAAEEQVKSAFEMNNLVLHANRHVYNIQVSNFVLLL